MIEKKIVWMLNELEGFKKPKIKLEQYATSSELAVSMMELIDDKIGIDGTFMADLGCGCGMLMTTAAACFQPLSVLGVDIDEDALEICSKNLKNAKINEKCDLIKADVLNVDKLIQPIFDIVVMNPPFGTKNNAGIDMKFVKVGLSLLKNGGSVFSLHKSSTRDFIIKSSKKWENVDAKCIAEMKWQLPATYKFHKQKAVDIDVDLIRFQKK